MELSPEILIQIAYALGVGMLIGLERSLVVVLADDEVGPPPRPSASSGGAGLQVADADLVAVPGSASAPEVRDEHAGMRTFAIVSLLGYVAALLGQHAEGMSGVPAVGLMVVGLLVIAMYFRASDYGYGITTEAALIATCGLGMLCRTQPKVAMSAASVVMP